MKIHTTQNLSVLAQQQPSNSVSLSELGFTRKTKEKQHLPQLDPQPLINGAIAAAVLAGIVILARKKSNKITIEPKDARYIIKQSANKLGVGNINEKALPEIKRGDKFKESKFFDVMLHFAENEPVIQAAMAALICIGLRPATIMALPNKDRQNGKQNNMYAAAHSMSSGVMGIVSTLIIAQPFKMGANYTMKTMYKDLSEKTLKRLSPHLDMKSIYKADGSRELEEKWLDNAGNKFVKDFKNVDKIPIFKSFNEISAESFKQFGADVDWAAQKGKSFNEVLTKDGKSLYDVLDWNRVGIIIERNGRGDANVLIKDLDKNFFEQVIKDADRDSSWKKLDLKTVFDKNGRTTDYKTWKDIEGKQWKLDLDNAYISSPYDTASYIPRISGKTREEETNKKFLKNITKPIKKMFGKEVSTDPILETKYTTYFKNGKDGYLGTEIDQSLANTDKRNEIINKNLTWLPDLLSRPLIASATIALIPIALKNVFHLEKASSKPEVKESDNKLNNAQTNAEVKFKGKNEVSNDETDNKNNISFKGKKPVDVKNGDSAIKKFFERFIAKPLAKAYGKPLYESERMSKIAERLMKLPGKMTTHMATLGALITSSVYMHRTLKKKDLDADRRRTLALNQAFCFVVPTIGAYAVDSLLNDWIKKQEYRYAGLQEQKVAIAKLEKKDAKYIEELQKNMGRNLKTFRPLCSLAVFTLIYRYVAPVLITPLANSIGEYFNTRRKLKAEASSQNEAVRVSMNQPDDSKKVNTAA